MFFFLVDGSIPTSKPNLDLDPYEYLPIQIRILEALKLVDPTNPDPALDPELCW
jgi:hypothetical protein